MKHVLSHAVFAAALVLAGSASAASYTYSYSGANYTDVAYSDGMFLGPDATIAYSGFPGFGGYSDNMSLAVSFTLEEMLPANAKFTLDVGISNQAFLMDSTGGRFINTTALSVFDGLIDHANFRANPGPQGPFFSGDITTDAAGKIAEWDLQYGYPSALSSVSARSSNAAGDAVQYRSEYGLLAASPAVRSGLLPYETAETSKGSTLLSGSWTSDVEIIANPLPASALTLAGGFVLLIGLRQLRRRKTRS